MEPQPATPEQLELARKTRPAVAKVIVRGGEESSVGTAFLITKNGIAVTNFHVLSQKGSTIGTAGKNAALRSEEHTSELQSQD